MNNQKVIIFVTALLLMAGSAGLLARFKANQKLGRAGVKTSPIAGSRNVVVELPASLPGYKSEAVETQPIVIGILPKDTSFGQRRYQADDGFQALMNVVLMGEDRTSLHKPQYCVEGAGWKIDQTETTTMPIERPHHYELPVIKLTTTKEGVINGQPYKARGIYVYWYVADGMVSGEPSGFNRMWGMAKHLLRTGELQRWAYIYCFATCRPGEEAGTYKRMRELIAASVPEFQLATPGQVATQAAAFAGGKELSLSK